MWKVAHKPFQRAHTFNALHNWTSAVLSKLFLRSAVTFNKLFSVMGITKVEPVMREKYFLFSKMDLSGSSLCRWSQSSRAGLSSQVSGAHRLWRRYKDTAERFTLTRALLTCFGIESQQSSPMFQQIYHACQLLKFRSGPCLSSCHFLGKKKHLPEDSNDYQWL